MADFSLLQNQNFAGALQSGITAGQALGKQKQLDTALQGADLSRPETLLPILRADPQTGAALIGTSLKLHAEDRDQQSKQATANYVKTIYGNGGPLAPQPVAGDTGSSSVATPSTPSTPSMVAPTPDTAAQPGDIVVNGTKQPDPNAVRNAAIDGDPTGFMALQGHIDAHLKQATEQQLARATDTTNAVANVGQQALQLPYPQRKAFIQAQAGYLQQHGLNADAIAAFDPTDDNIHTQVGQALGIKAQAQQRMEEMKFAEQKRHAGVEEGQGSARIGLEAQSIGISAGHLSLDRAKETREAGKATGASSPIPSVTTKAAYSALPRGASYRAPDGSLRVKS